MSLVSDKGIRQRHGDQGPLVGSQNTAALALQTLLQNPLHFVPATKRTQDDEDKFSANRKRRLATTDDDQASDPGEDAQRSENCRYSVDSQPTRKARKERKPEVEDSSYKAGERGTIKAEKVCPAWSTAHTSVKTSRGFSNPHVHCYRNSTLQAMFHAPALVNWLEDHRVKCARPTACTAHALAELSRAVWTKGSAHGHMAAQMARLRENLKSTKEFAKWRWGRQQDANEFYLYLINAVIERESGCVVLFKALSCSGNFRVLCLYLH